MSQPATVQDIIAKAQVEKASGVQKIPTSAIPGFLPSGGKAADFNGYKIKYSKIDFDDIGSIAELEILETRALRNDGVFILSKERFTFMDKFFLILQYMEKDSSK